MNGWGRGWGPATPWTATQTAPGTLRPAGMRTWSQDVDVPAGGGLLIKVELTTEGEKR